MQRTTGGPVSRKRRHPRGDRTAAPVGLSSSCSPGGRGSSKRPDMFTAEAAALIATALALVGAVPQLRRLAVTGDANGVSLTNATLGVGSELGWVAYTLQGSLWSAIPEAALMAVTNVLLARALMRAGVSIARPVVLATIPATHARRHDAARRVDIARGAAADRVWHAGRAVDLVGVPDLGAERRRRRHLDDDPRRVRVRWGRRRRPPGPGADDARCDRERAALAIVVRVLWTRDRFVDQGVQLHRRVEIEAAIPLGAGSLAVAGVCRDQRQEAAWSTYYGWTSIALASWPRVAHSAVRRSSALAPVDASNSRNPE